MLSFKPLNLFLLLALLLPPIVYGFNPRKLDETPAVPGEQKCGECAQSPPPPSPPPPSPPPPDKPPPSPKKPPSTPYCPPPPGSPGSPGPPGPPSPSGGLIYITGPPGQLYPIDHNFNGAARSSGLPLLLACGLLGLLAFW